ncbi:hypothetical protein F5J12DRAFT_966016 [Pisolithus orientalis]|uniref:uncharacterized protein n=1 Tax=Pisolithus orientalis TaxID=936130 RepID=UPI0022243D43|nr:uncharacterized protein F5J12DRAFT_966016 [Pisolithus orientalis]KAI5991754.1 hypothetical protein F5J12DRAFT_966016 [Pisolithus orientalis]
MERVNKNVDIILSIPGRDSSVGRTIGCQKSLRGVKKQSHDVGTISYGFETSSQTALEMQYCEHSMPPSIGELYGLVIHANAESIVSDTSLAPFESAELSRMIDIVRVLQGLFSIILAGLLVDRFNAIKQTSTFLVAFLYLVYLLLNLPSYTRNDDTWNRRVVGKGGKRHYEHKEGQRGDGRARDFGHRKETGLHTGEEAEARVEMTTAFETKGGVQDLQPSEPQMTKIAWGRFDDFDIVTFIRIARSDVTSRFDGVITPLHHHKEGQLRGAFDDAKFGAVAEIELLGSKYSSALVHTRMRGTSRDTAIDRLDREQRQDLLLSWLLTERIKWVHGCKIDKGSLFPYVEVNERLKNSQHPPDTASSPATIPGLVLTMVL